MNLNCFCFQKVCSSTLFVTLLLTSVLIFLILPLGATLRMFVLFSGQKIICMSPVYSTIFTKSFELSR